MLSQQITCQLLSVVRPQIITHWWSLEVNRQLRLPVKILGADPSRKRRSK